MSPGSAFLKFWWIDNIRNTFLSCLPKEELSSLRLACHDFSIRAAPLLFEDITIVFRTNTFTKPARLAALARIGQHVRTLTFSMAHSPKTFLPPLLDSTTGEEVEFIYEPFIQPSRRSTSSRLSVPKYGTWEMTDVLIKQYPPLFHAAANVPSFIRAFATLTNLIHLRVSTSNQEPAQRYRRSAVDYALISLRIAVERTRLNALCNLSLIGVHPSALFYLNPIMSLGALPSSMRRWSQIRILVIQMDSISLTPNKSGDHFKHLHAYLRTFSPFLEHLTFRWLGAKSFSPLSLSTEPSLALSPPLTCPRRCHVPLRPLKFRRLGYMEVENAALDASQVSQFITAHHRTLKEFKFEDTELRTGTWDEALAPLTQISGNENWKEKSEEVMDVPLVLSPMGLDHGYVARLLGNVGAGQRGSRRSKAASMRPLPSCVGSLQRVGARGKELFWGSPEHVKNWFLRNSVVRWR